MAPAFRFRLRTLLASLSALVVCAGGARWWYDSRLAEYERQRRVVAWLEECSASISWSYVGPPWLEAWKLHDGPLFRRPTQAYCESAPPAQFAAVVEQIGELDIATLVVLARQVVPQAYEAKAGGASPIIDGLRRHDTLERLVVDASIRGAPLEFDAPLYTRQDEALLEELLPNVRIEWIEVN